MSRPVRVEFPGALYHVLSHGVNGAPTFVDDLDRRTFLDFLHEFVAIQKFIVFAFVLMGNHFHLLLQTPLAGLSRYMTCRDCLEGTRGGSTDGIIAMGIYGKHVIRQLWCRTGTTFCTARVTFTSMRSRRISALGPTATAGRVTGGIWVRTQAWSGLMFPKRLTVLRIAPTMRPSYFKDCSTTRPIHLKTRSGGSFSAALPLPGSYGRWCARLS